ncbi:MAG: hypothetical protein EB100_02445, partial [Crocinitomicaceae bacterium]|nr:hypothetical protein [Crocinitomicaceae bacterium]
EKTIASATVSQSAAIEDIDIGGVSLLRASAKNYKSVWSVSSISQYDKLITGLALQLDGLIDKAAKIRQEMAVESFRLISKYDSAISTYLATISSNVFSGICSILTKISFKYKAFANLKPPFEIF